MSLERPYSRASSGGRGPPPTPPPTYLWEELRRSRSRGGYPWTILDKEPLPDYLDSEILLRGEIPIEYVRGRTFDKRSHYRNRLEERERTRRARSEPTPSIPHSCGTSMSGVVMADQASAVNPSIQSSEYNDDFPLGDEEIPDYVMAYLQSDNGNLDEDIPDHILEYIQSRAAVLEKSQKRNQLADTEELFYTEEELRIIEEARKRLEEEGELDVAAAAENATAEEVDHFDEYFHRAASVQQEEVAGGTLKAHSPAPSEDTKKKKSGKFNFRSISMPSKVQLSNIKLPKFGHDKKKVKNSKDNLAESTEKKQRRPRSTSPMRQKITQQLESWGNTLKRLKVRGRDHKDGQVKSFVALLPGHSKSKPKEAEEHQYEEVGRPRPEISNPILMVTQPDNVPSEGVAVVHQPSSSAAEETMDEIENLPESEVVETIASGMIVDSEVVDAVETQEAFVDIDMEDDFESDEEVDEGVAEQPPANAAPVAEQSKVSTGLATRGRKALQATKSKIQTSLSKEQLQAAGRKVQSTTKRNLRATRDLLQSTLSKKNLQATRDKLQTTLSGTLKKKKSEPGLEALPPVPTPPASLPPITLEDIFSPGEAREFETSTPVFAKVQRKATERPLDEEDLRQDSPPPIPIKRTKNRNAKSLTSLNRSGVQECEDIAEEAEEVEPEEEIEPKMEFSLHGSDKPTPPSVSQSTETLPEDELESDKENVVIRPKRHRYRHRRHGFHEDVTPAGRPHSAHYESDKARIRSSWGDEVELSYPALSQEILEAFARPINSLEAVNSSWGSLRKPERPSRSRKRLNSARDHFYANVPAPYDRTWPRNKAVDAKPVAPKRFKPKPMRSVMAPVGVDYQTWPRRSAPTNKSPPAAPKRSRARRTSSKKSVDMKDLEMQIESPKMNILVDADVLFGAEGRFIDDELDIDQAVNRFPAKMDNNVLKEHDRNVPVSYNITNEDKILNEANENAPPLAPCRFKSRTLTKAKTHKAQPRSYEEATWPRASKQPSAPRRNKRKPGKKCTTLDELLPDRLELTKLPAVPASTPAEDNQVAEPTGSESPSIQLDQILEILATFPQEEPSPSQDEVLATAKSEEVQQAETEPLDTVEENVHSTEKVNENPYAEIKHLKKKKKNPPPPRPPPPAHASENHHVSPYSYIYTIPRRKNREHDSARKLPSRPPRTYCTIRPHRPPRSKRRSHTQEITVVASQSVEEGTEPNPIRRHSFSGINENQVSKEDMRDLQAAPIVERMRARPLPAPPGAEEERKAPSKPPRSRTASLQHQTAIPVAEQNAETPVKEAAPEEQPAVCSLDGYEPIENPEAAVPVKTQEISIGIQTDPEYEEYDESTNTGRADETLLFSDETSNDQAPENVQEVAPIVEQIQQAVESSPRPESEPIEKIIWSSANSPDPDDEPVNKDNTTEKKAKPSTEDRPIKSDDKTEHKEPPREDDDDDSSSYSRIPADFHLVRALNPLRLDLPSRLQLSELEVERMNVREVVAERLVVSSVDTNTLQVSHTTSASGQLIFNIGSGVTIPSLTEMTAQQGNQEGTSPSTATAESSDSVLPSTSEPRDVTDHQVEQHPPASVPREPLQSCGVSAREREATSEPVMIHPNANSPMPQENASVGDLAVQLVSLSAQNVARGACAAVSHTYSAAQRVAELGLRQINEQLQSRGIQFDDKEKENLKAILLILLIVVSAIFLLGMGKQKLGNHWEFYFTN